MKSIFKGKLFRLASCTNQLCARKPDTGILKNGVTNKMDSEHSVQKRQDYLSKWSVAAVNFSPERHEKQCPIHSSTGFSWNFL